jgi:hypothetical protein
VRSLRRTNRRIFKRNEYRSFPFFGWASAAFQSMVSKVINYSLAFGEVPVGVSERGKDGRNLMPKCPAAVSALHVRHVSLFGRLSRERPAGKNR